MIKKILNNVGVSIIYVLIVVVFSIIYNVFGSQYIYDILKLKSVFYLIMFLSLATIIGWNFIFSILKKPSSFKQKLANYYILFLVSVLNHEKIPDKFFIFTMTLGAFLGRRIVLIYSIPYPKSFFICIVLPFLTFSISFFLVFGYFLICLQYPSVFGKHLVNFFEKNASKEVLAIIDPQKRKYLKKKFTNKRFYSSSTTKRNKIFENMATLKLVGNEDSFLAAAVLEVAKALDAAKGISSHFGSQILDHCIQTGDLNLCSDYVAELAKSPEKRNLAFTSYGGLSYKMRIVLKKK